MKAYLDRFDIQMLLNFIQDQRLQYAEAHEMEAVKALQETELALLIRWRSAVEAARADQESLKDDLTE